MNDRPTDEWGSKLAPRNPSGQTSPVLAQPGLGADAAPLSEASHPATGTRTPMPPRVYDRAMLTRPAPPQQPIAAALTAASPQPVPAKPPAIARADRVPPPTRPPTSRRWGCWTITLTLLLGAALGMCVIGGILIGYASIAAGLPAPDELQARASQFNSTLIYDREGGLLNEVADPNYGRRTAVSLDTISPYLSTATLATEDPNFYEHLGVDPAGIARALYHAVRYRDLDSGPGGSTITQQLVKLTFLSPERSLTRKIKEAILAAEITRRYPKDKILEIYLNEIYYGNLAYGI